MRIDRTERVEKDLNFQSRAIQSSRWGVVRFLDTPHSRCRFAAYPEEPTMLAGALALGNAGAVSESRLSPVVSRDRRD